jgi:hypothetical protein
MIDLDLDDLARVHGGEARFDPTKSDGCTLAPDGWWRSACVAHDEKYFYGGSSEDRLRADRELRDAMIRLGAPKLVAHIYYYGVRAGGAAGTGLPWRWGFGKSQ